MIPLVHLLVAMVSTKTVMTIGTTVITVYRDSVNIKVITVIHAITITMLLHIVSCSTYLLNS